MGPLLAGFLSFLALLSPILMAALPKFGLFGLRKNQLLCGVECDGILVSLSFKLFVLLIGTWAVFYRNPRSTLPRIHIYRSLVCLLILVFLVSIFDNFLKQFFEHFFSVFRSVFGSFTQVTCSTKQIESTTKDWFNSRRIWSTLCFLSTIRPFCFSKFGTKVRNFTSKSSDHQMENQKDLLLAKCQCKEPQLGFWTNITRNFPFIIHFWTD